MLSQKFINAPKLLYFYYNYKTKPNQSVVIFLSSVILLNCIWTLAPKGWTVVNYLSKLRHRETYFCEKNNIFHVNLGGIRWAFEMHKTYETVHQTRHIWALLQCTKLFVACKLLLHLNKEITLGITICFSPPLNNEYVRHKRSSVSYSFSGMGQWTSAPVKLRKYRT